MRKEKDQIIADLHYKIEELRKNWESKVNNLTITVETHEKTILLRDSEILALQQLLRKKEDVEKQLAELLVREQENQKGRDTLRIELENGTDYILELEEKVYKANKTSLELLKQLKDAEVEIETLKQYIIDLKQRIAVYIPVKEDHVDRKLAEFINNYPERSKLKIMFMRESEGVYQFGTKRVAVKVEKDNIKIRVGGGYLSLDEFLDQYTPVELEKLERKDPLKRFSEKIAVQKTIVTQAVRESSPVRHDGAGSPSRKSTRRQEAV
jgi:DNA repair exonuclease SbcCD ATPase subunit